MIKEQVEIGVSVCETSLQSIHLGQGITAKYYMLENCLLLGNYAYGMGLDRQELNHVGFLRSLNFMVNVMGAIKGFSKRCTHFRFMV